MFRQAERQCKVTLTSCFRLQLVKLRTEFHADFSSSSSPPPDYPCMCGLTQRSTDTIISQISNRSEAACPYSINETALLQTNTVWAPPCSAADSYAFRIIPTCRLNPREETKWTSSSQEIHHERCREARNRCVLSSPHSNTITLAQHGSKGPHFRA